MNNSNRQRLPTTLNPAFGERGYAVVSDLTRLPQLLPKLYLNLTGAAH